MNRYEREVFAQVYASIERLTPPAPKSRAERASDELACRGLKAMIVANKIALAEAYEADGDSADRADMPLRARASWAKAKAIREQLAR